jgi:arginine deiminase
MGGEDVSGISVPNDIGKLRRVLVHAPGRESADHSTSSFDQVFFIRAAFGKRSFDFSRASEEHEALVSVLQEHGVEVLSLEDLLAQAIDGSPEARQAFINGYVDECGVQGMELRGAVRRCLEEKETGTELVNKALTGVTYGETDLGGTESLAECLGASYDDEAVLAGPFSTMFFTKDPIATVNDGAVACNMYWNDRARETLLYKTVFSFHPAFAGTKIWLRDRSSYHIEGGDVANLGSGSLMVGISDRTEAAAVDSLARELLWSESGIDRVFAVPVRSQRRRIHLDTYISRVDADKFVVDPGFERDFRSYEIARGRREGILTVSESDESLRQLLSRATRTGQCTLISPQDTLSSEWEIEDSSPSVLCIEPGVCCARAGNNNTNEALAAAGVEVIEVTLEELTYGFGGPNSLVLPLWRDE